MRTPVAIEPDSDAEATLDTDDGPRIYVICACGFNIGEEKWGIDPFTEESVTCPNCERVYVASVSFTYRVEEHEP